MNDDRYEYWQQRVGERLAYWSGFLRLDDWRKEVLYQREGGRFDGRLRYMQITSSWRYKQLCLTVYVNVLEDIDPDALFLDEMIAHELLHAHMDELSAHVPEDRQPAHFDHEERVVSTLAAILANAHFHYDHEFDRYDAKVRRLRRKVKRLRKAAA